MTSSLLPVGVASERVAEAAVASCFDTIESAAAEMAGKRGAIDAMRASLRVQLYEYALQVAGTTYATPALATDTTAREALDPPANW